MLPTPTTAMDLRVDVDQAPVLSDRLRSEHRSRYGRPPAPFRSRPRYAGSRGTNRGLVPRVHLPQSSVRLIGAARLYPGCNRVNFDATAVARGVTSPTAAKYLTTNVSVIQACIASQVMGDRTPVHYRKRIHQLLQYPPVKRVAFLALHQDHAGSIDGAEMYPRQMRPLRP